MSKLGPHSRAEDWMTLEEAAAEAGASTATVYSAMRRGEIPGLRTADGRWRVRRIGVVEWDGPSKGGRPEVGPAVNLRFPPELLEAVDQRAAAEGTTRAALIRRLVADGLIDR